MEPLEQFGIVVGRENVHEAAIYGLACAYLHIEKEIADYLRPFELTPAKFNAMMVIKHQGKDKGLSQVQIGRSLIVTASNMTRLLDRLEREGFIERSGKENDRRVKLIRISRKGTDILDQAWPGYRKKMMELSGLLNTEELRRFSGLILDWCGKLECHGGRETPKKEYH